MSNETVFQMDFSKIYDALLGKAARKGRTKAEVDQVICWLTGYHAEDLEKARASSLSFGDFFRSAPAPNPNRVLIKGAGPQPVPDRYIVPLSGVTPFRHRSSSTVTNQ